MKNKTIQSSSVSKIIKDVEDFSIFIASKCASLVRDKLRYEYLWSIQNFYDSYEPEQYYRGFGLYDGFVPFYKNSRNQTFYGGIIISDDRMKDAYKDPKDYVLWMSMMGQHGTSAIQTAAPHAHVLKVKNEIIDNFQPYANTAVLQAKKAGYGYLFER